MPKVSVIIPTYNRAKLLPRAVNSVLNQTFKDFELIIVDDASTDNTEEVVKTFKDSRIKYIKHRINKGGAAARNTGIKASKGEYIAFLDDDDEWLPLKLEKQVFKFNESSSKVGLIYTGFSRYLDGENKEREKHLPRHKGKVLDICLAGCLTSPPEMLIRKELLKEIGGFDEKLKASQDADILIRLAQECDFDFIPEALTKHYIHGKQISSDLKLKIESYEYLISKYKTIYTKFPDILSMKLNHLAKLYCLNNMSRKKLTALLQSIRYKPIQKDSYVHFLFSVILPNFIHKKIVLRNKMKKRTLKIY